MCIVGPGVDKEAVECIRVLFELDTTNSAGEGKGVIDVGDDDEKAHGAKILGCRGLAFRCLDEMDGLRAAVQSLLTTEVSIGQYVNAVTDQKGVNPISPLPDNHQVEKFRDKFHNM